MKIRTEKEAWLFIAKQFRQYGSPGGMCYEIMYSQIPESIKKQMGWKIKRALSRAKTRWDEMNERRKRGAFLFPRNEQGDKKREMFCLKMAKTCRKAN